MSNDLFDIPPLYFLEFIFNDLEVDGSQRFHQYANSSLFRMALIENPFFPLKCAFKKIDWAAC